MVFESQRHCGRLVHRGMRMGVVSTGSDVFHCHVLHGIVITVVSPENKKKIRVKIYNTINKTFDKKKDKRRIELWVVDINIYYFVP